MVGAEYNTHHGLTNAIILPVVLRFNLPDMQDKVHRMAQAMNMPDHSVYGFINSVEAMLDEIAIPKSLGEISVPTDCAGRIAEKALKDSAARTNPRAATLAEVQVLTETAIAKAR
jgi:alcohol dehydrogenase class IV